MAVQLAGCEPAVVAEAARLNADRGAAIIDINFGCPVKKVVNGHAGSALMRDELHAARILAATVKAVDLPVTLKMRTGWDHANRNAPRLARIDAVLGGVRAQVPDGSLHVGDAIHVGRPVEHRPVLEAGHRVAGLGQVGPRRGPVLLLGHHEPAAGDVDDQGSGARGPGQLKVQLQRQGLTVK